MKSAWTEATALYGAGNVVDAVTKGEAVKERATRS